MSDAERAAEIADRQAKVANLLGEFKVDGAVFLDPANFAWLTAGATPCLAADPAEPPGLFYLEKQRWVLCANVDSQRLFDEELDDLGFQVKEWPWQLGREKLLYGLINGRKLACDQALNNCINAADAMRQLRRVRSPWDIQRLRELGRTMAHALEATCRDMHQGDSEQEAAGHLSHRLIHKGATPVAVHIAADGRLRRYRRVGSSKKTIEQNCIMQATARRRGLHVTASRAMSFGPPDDEFRRDYDFACRLSGVYASATRVGTNVAVALDVGQRLLQPQGLDHEWREAPVGWLTGVAPVELPITPHSTEEFQVGTAVVWAASVGAGLVTDTFVVAPNGPDCLTLTDQWPYKSFKIGDMQILRPDMLIRT